MDDRVGAHGKRDPWLIRSEQPFNAGPALAVLEAGLITPVDRFYVRNHGSIPTVAGGAFRLRVGGAVERELELSLEELGGLPQRSVVATLQCAGNRRDELSRLEPTTGEIGWSAEAIGTARWTGVRVADVLAIARPTFPDGHVAAEGGDEVVREGRQVGFGGSIPLAKALAPETLLATHMNGVPLPPVHGAPLRLVVPGYIGARSVKWLTELRVQEMPSSNHFQARSYRLFPASVREAHADWETALPLGETSVNSVICSPADGARCPAGPRRISGYATAGGDRRVARVEVSTDGGSSWRTASFRAREHGADGGEARPGGPADAPELGDGRWTWRLWSLDAVLEPGRHELVVRAWDTAANTQPERLQTVWNFKGYLNTAWHRVTIHVGET